MLYKTIIQGRLEFGNQKSYDKVLKMFEYRSENYYKSDILFNGEDIFHAKASNLIVPRYVGQVSEKSWKNTVSLLGYCAQFAVSGSMRAWMTDSGKILRHSVIEPESDKIAVQEYLKGKSLINEEGQEDNAIEALTRAIEKYNRHAMAYERRAKVNFMMKKFGEAMRDYNKSIGMDDTNPLAYFGRAKVHTINDDFELAIADYEKALKSSIALQSIYWEARRLKAECHMRLEQYDKAIFDLKLFTKRKFQENDKNIKWRKDAYYTYGCALIKTENFEEAVNMFDLAIENPEKPIQFKEDELLLQRAIAKQSASMNGFINDLKQSADKGNKRAKQLLKEYA